ncbi:MAG: hypothetical protein M3258_01365 [Thermoproteota archaeon]|nr:hypothetical protein [Thermoproteota archaeon]
MASSDNNYPIIAEHDGIKLKPEKMIPDKLYYCIHDNKVFLFYKDEEHILHCYEVEHPEAVKEITKNPSELDSILRKYANIDQP